MTAEHKLQQDIYAALTSDARLSGISVVKHIASYEDAPLPCIVYNIISDVPANHGDNVEIASRITVQVSIVSNVDDDVDELEEAVADVMHALDFMRVSRDEITEEEKFYTIALRYATAVMR